MSKVQTKIEWSLTPMSKDQDRLPVLTVVPGIIMTMRVQLRQYWLTTHLIFPEPFGHSPISEVMSGLCQKMA